MRSVHLVTCRTIGEPRRRLTQRLLSSVVGGGLFLAIALSLLTVPSAAASDRPPGGNFANPVVRQADIAAPAVVRVATTVTGSITFNLCGQRASLTGQTLGGTGSGAFVSAHGDVLTADHVVHIPREILDEDWFLSPRLAAEIARLLDRYASCLG